MGDVGFKIYRSRLKKVLSKEEQKRYVELSKEGDYDAQEKLFEHNLRLVFFVIDSFFSNSKIDNEDLFQSGSIGLWKSIKNYDAENGAEFSTYATKKIWGEIKSYSRKYKYLLKIPKSLRLMAQQVVEIKEKFSDKDLSTKEIAELLRIDEAEVVLSINAMHNIFSLSEPINSDDEDQILSDVIVDTHVSVDEVVEQNERTNLIKNVFCILDEREQTVVNLLYGFNGEIKTQTEISKILNISQPMVSEINKRALKKIKYELVKESETIDLLELKNRKKFNIDDSKLKDNEHILMDELLKYFPVFTKEEVLSIIDTLNEKHQNIVKLKYGLDGNKAIKNTEIATRFNMNLYTLSQTMLNIRKEIGTKLEYTSNRHKLELTRKTSVNNSVESG